MTIKLEELAKKYDKQVLFKALSTEFHHDRIYGIFGHNGSGKSTLLKIISGKVSPTKGKIIYLTKDGTDLPVEEVHHQISFCAPYQELFPDLSLKEQLDFHGKFRQWREGINTKTIIQQLNFEPEKKIKDFSSGMYQKLKLAIAVFTKSEVLLLDEPTANFDEEGIVWYKSLIQDHSSGRIVIIASALKEDISPAGSVIDIKDYR